LAPVVADRELDQDRDRDQDRDQDREPEQELDEDPEQELDEDPGGMEDCNNRHRNRPGLGLDLDEEDQVEDRELDEERELGQDRALDGKGGKFGSSRHNRVHHRRSYRPCSFPYCLH
jgi:hypothetical protein